MAWDKRGGFTGREALLRQREQGVERRPVQFALADPMLYHKEPVWRDGARVGRITSGMFGHTLGSALGLGYVPGGDAASGRFEIEVAGERIAATASLSPMYDPKSLRVKDAA